MYILAAELAWSKLITTNIKDDHMPLIVAIQDLN
jgi:hypothetical protein